MQRIWDSDKSDERVHLEQYPKFQSVYKSDVSRDSRELLDFDQLIFMPPDVVDNVIKVKDVGYQLCTTFLNKRVSSQEEAFTATMHKTNLGVQGFCLKHTESHQEPQEIYQDFVGSEFWSHQQPLCFLP